MKNNIPESASKPMGSGRARLLAILAGAAAAGGCKGKEPVHQPRYEADLTVDLFAKHGLWVSGTDPQIQIETRPRTADDRVPGHLQCDEEGEWPVGDRFAFTDVQGWWGPGSARGKVHAVLCRRVELGPEEHRVGRLLFLEEGFNADDRTRRFSEVNFNTREVGHCGLLDPERFPRDPAHCRPWGFVSPKSRYRQERGR